MSLLESILDSERKANERVCRKGFEQLQGYKKEQIEEFINKAIEWSVEKTRLLVKKAYDLNGSSITDKDLTFLYVDSVKLEMDYFGRIETFPGRDFLEKELTKSRIKFFQEIIEQDTDSYEQAIKLKFGNEEAYRKRMEELSEILNKIYDLYIIFSTDLQGKEANRRLRDAEYESSESHIKEIFKI